MELGAIGSGTQSSWNMVGPQALAAWRVNELRPAFRVESDIIGHLRMVICHLLIREALPWAALIDAPGEMTDNKSQLTNDQCLMFPLILDTKFRSNP